MIAPETTALILLAAGRSTRFGVSNKLNEIFLGHPLGLHVVTALEGVPFAKRIAVRDGLEIDYAAHGYTVVHNDDPDAGVSRSLRLGVEAARGDGIEAVVIALADMPRVTAAQIYRLFDAENGLNSVVASSDGISPKPPALFGAGRFDALMALKSDGARALIRAGRHVVTQADELIDVDTQEELDALRAKFALHRASGGR